MAVDIDGITYFSTTEVAEKAGVSRQTLWRWRTEGKVPQGSKFRSRNVVFTATEVKEIQQYAYRVEPIEGADPRQLKLFAKP